MSVRLPVSAVSALRLGLAVAGARCASLVCLALGRGGTSLPGLLALRLEPSLVQRLAEQLGRGSIVVAGTNGKTTTSALLAAALTRGGRRVLHNRAGSNMLRGLATTLSARACLTGSLRAGAGLTGLFEVDEAALPDVLAQVAPRIVLLTNLFRDQLDRYAELQLIAGRWRAAIRRLPSTAILVLNADDPLVASLGADAPGQVLYFGVERWEGEVPATEPAASADSLYCPSCAAPLRFASLSYAHLGHWSCPGCGLSRPPLNLAAIVHRTGAEGSTLAVREQPQHVDVDSGAIHLHTLDRTVELHLGLPGRYNVYNALAALAAARAANVDLPVAARALAEARGAFGRAETIYAAGRTVQLYLIKNPTGADEVLRVVAAGDRSATLLVLLSDQAADGHDVSWIWDAQLDLVQDWSGPLRCGGTRAEDMALRLKYAGLPAPVSVIGDDVPRAVREALVATPRGGCLVIVATYTAMLAARHTLARAGHVAEYWKVSQA